MTDKEQIAALKAEVERMNRLFALPSGYKKERDALALALSDARAALEEVYPWYEGEHSHDHPSSVKIREVLSRTSDPTALLEAHDREREAKVWNEVMKLYDRYPGDALSIFTVCKERAAALRRSAEAGDRKEN